MDSETQSPKKEDSLKIFKLIDSRYQVMTKVLGEGSFAVTYLTLDLKTKKTIACKMISKKHLINKINSSRNKSVTKDYFVHALKSEVKTWMSLHHNNIVQFVDYSETANNIYFFLQYCPGGNLESMVTKKGFIPQKDALKIMYQIASGAAYLYDLGVFHRDIKPQNILQAEDGTMKISDFGFAKVLDEQSKQNAVQQTCAGRIVFNAGTPIYMSPQVLRGQPYTIKCDVWSIGVMFYKMLFGLIPWENTQNVAVLVERMNGPVHFPPHIKIDQWLKKLLLKMLQVKEQNRVPIKQVKKILEENITGKMELQ